MSALLVSRQATFGLTILNLWDIVQNYAYPQVSMLHQFLEWGMGTARPSDGPQPSDGFWVLELGSHAALSKEPVAMLSKALTGYDVAHLNFVKPYDALPTEAVTSGRPGRQ